MLESSMFEKSNTKSQFFYTFTNKTTGETIQITRNKEQKHWFATYIDNNNSIMFLLPINSSTSIEKVLKESSYWYNNEKKPYCEKANVVEDELLTSTSELDDFLELFQKEDANKIQSFINEPTIENWDNISSIELGKYTTLWQLLVLDDINFPKSGPLIDSKGNVIKNWSKVPTSEDILRVLQKQIK